MNLSPAEYLYLSGPFGVSGKDLFKLTLQDLCLKGIIEVERRWILINGRDTRKRARFFFSTSHGFDQYATQSEAERFILTLFEKYPEFRFFKLRQYLKHHFKKKGLLAFKTDYLLKDLAAANLSFLKYIPSRSGRSQVREVDAHLAVLKKQLAKDHSKQDIEACVQQLGTLILLLEREELEKLNTISKTVLDIHNLTLLENLNRSFNSFEEFFLEDLVFDTILSESFDFGGLDTGDFGFDIDF